MAPARVCQCNLERAHRLYRCISMQMFHNRAHTRPRRRCDCCTRRTRSCTCQFGPQSVDCDRSVVGPMMLFKVSELFF